MPPSERKPIATLAYHTPRPPRSLFPVFRDTLLGGLIGLGIGGLLIILLSLPTDFGLVFVVFTIPAIPAAAMAIPALFLAGAHIRRAIGRAPVVAPSRSTSMLIGGMVPALSLVLGWVVGQAFGEMEKYIMVQCVAWTIPPVIAGIFLPERESGKE